MAEALIARLDRTIDVMLAGGDATAALTDAELAPLARLASDLRSCPSAAFKARLRAKLERKKTMSIVLEDVKTREGFTTVTPYMQTAKPGLLDFLTRAFGAVETETTTTPRGVHREVRVGNSMVMIGEGGPEDAVYPPAAFHVFVPDVDAAYERAIAAGATSLGEPADRPYGERSGFVKDAFGNHWYIATSLGPTPVPEGLRTVTPYLHPRGVPSYIDFLTRAFSAVEEFRAEHGGVVMHAQVCIGNAIVEMGEGSDATTRQAMFYLYVADCDALYAQAVAAGAKPLAPPADMFYGDRVGSVEDAMGITWYIARPA